LSILALPSYLSGISLKFKPSVGMTHRDALFTQLNCGLSVAV
jgi:hypothetical protein